MYMPEYVLDNERHIDIQMDHLIQHRKPDQMFIIKKNNTCHLMNFAVFADHWKKKKNENEKIFGNFLDLVRMLKKL